MGIITAPPYLKNIISRLGVFFSLIFSYGYLVLILGGSGTASLGGTEPV